MQFYDIAHERIVRITLGQKHFKRFTDRAYREIASRSATAPKVMYGGVESLQACALRRFRERRISKVLDVRKSGAKKVEVTRAREPCRCVAVLNQGFNRDCVGTLCLFVERFALWGTGTSQDSTPVYRRR